MCLFTSDFWFGEEGCRKMAKKKKVARACSPAKCQRDFDFIHMLFTSILLLPHRAHSRVPPSLLSVATDTNKLGGVLCGTQQQQQDQSE